MGIGWRVAARVQKRSQCDVPVAVWWREDRLPVIALEARGRTWPPGSEWFVVRTPVGALRLARDHGDRWTVTAAPWWLWLPSWLARPAEPQRRFAVSWRARRGETSWVHHRWGVSEQRRDHVEVIVGRMRATVMAVGRHAMSVAARLWGAAQSGGAGRSGGGRARFLRPFARS